MFKQCHSRLSGIFLQIPDNSEGFWIHPPEADKSQNDNFETIHILHDFLNRHVNESSYLLQQ
jgi:hypothetical protein